MSVLKVGAAAHVVTPPLGLNIPQNMQFNPATGIKNDLYTHAVAVDDGKRTAILVSIDTSGLGAAFADRVRRALQKELGIDPDGVMVSAIHIHTGGPQLMDVYWGQGEDESVNELFLRETVAAAKEAYEKRVPVTAYFAEGREDRISFCRTYRLTDGSIKTNPGRKHAHEIVEPVTEIDHTLSTLRFVDEAGKPVCEIVNFACHPDTVGGQEYCADFPGELRENLKTVYGNDYTVLFFNGCSGNVNHIDAPRLTDPDFRYVKGEHHRYMGRVLADGVLALHKEAQPLTEGGVTFARRTFCAPRRQPEAIDLTWAAEALAKEGGSKVDKRLAEEILRLHETPKQTERVELQVIRLGNVYMAGFPGEPFSDLGLRLRAATAPCRLMISELANDELGYFATEPAYSGRVYEAILPSAPFEPAVLDRMVDMLAEMIQKM